MSDLLGLFLGGLLTSMLFFLVEKEDVNRVNMNNINETIAKCANSEYIDIQLISSAGTFRHTTTVVKCSDNATVVTTRVKRGK